MKYVLVLLVVCVNVHVALSSDRQKCADADAQDRQAMEQKALQSSQFANFQQLNPKSSESGTDEAQQELLQEKQQRFNESRNARQEKREQRRQERKNNFSRQ